MRPGWRFAALTASVRSAHCAAGAYGIAQLRRG